MIGSLTGPRQSTVWLGSRTSLASRYRSITCTGRSLPFPPLLRGKAYLGAPELRLDSTFSSTGQPAVSAASPFSSHVGEVPTSPQQSRRRTSTSYETSEQTK